MLFHQMQLMVCAVIAKRRSRDPEALPSEEPAAPAAHRGRHRRPFRLRPARRAVPVSRPCPPRPPGPGAGAGRRSRWRRAGPRGDLRVRQGPVPHVDVVDGAGEAGPAVDPFAEVHPEGRVPADRTQHVRRVRRRRTVDEQREPSPAATQGQTVPLPVVEGPVGAHPGRARGRRAVARGDQALHLPVARLGAQPHLGLRRADAAHPQQRLLPAGRRVPGTAATP